MRPVFFCVLLWPMGVIEQRRVRRLTASLATMWLLPVGLIVVVAAGATVGAVPLAVAALLALVPVPIYLVSVLALDRFEREPPHLLLFAFVWGATGAIAIALLMHGVALGAGAPEFFLAYLSAPVFEEGAKAVVLVVLYVRKRQEFDGIIDGVVYASMAGLGFAATENILYYSDAYLEGYDRLQATWIVRGLMAPFAHPFFTSAIGIGLGIARYSRHHAVRVIAPATGFSVSVWLHTLWNASAPSYFLAVYVLFMVPAFLLVIAILFASLLREGQVIREFLANDVAGGRLTAADLRRLATLRGRWASSCGALFQGGFRAWRRRREAQQAAADLAFLRRAAALEPDCADVAREMMFFEKLRGISER
jgi:RsiW-degrading membrane proteinase PrsW (M82 family)